MRNDRETDEAGQGRTVQEGKSSKAATPKVLAVLIVFAVAAGMITPPDTISMMTAMFGMVVVFGLILFPISRAKSFKQTPATMKRVIVILACLFAVSAIFSAILMQKSLRLEARLYEYVYPEDPVSVVAP